MGGIIMLPTPRVSVPYAGVRVKVHPETQEQLREARAECELAEANLRAFLPNSVLYTDAELVIFRLQARESLQRALDIVDGPWNAYDEFVFAQINKGARYVAVHCLERAIGFIPEDGSEANLRACHLAAASVRTLARKGGI